MSAQCRDFISCFKRNKPSPPSSPVPGLSFVLIDGGVQGDLPFSLHHMARFWCARVSCLLPQIPLQGPGVWFVGPRARTLGGALQRWDRTLRNLRLGGHLPDPGRWGGASGEGFLAERLEPNIRYLYWKQQLFFVAQEPQVVVRREVERMAVFLVQQIQRERLWHVVVFLWIASEIFPSSSSKKSSDFSGMLELVGMSSVLGWGEALKPWNYTWSRVGDKRKLQANPQKTCRVSQSSEQFSELGSLVWNVRFSQKREGKKLLLTDGGDGDCWLPLCSLSSVLHLSLNR